MSLAKYKNKRDFEKSPEPKGKSKKSPEMPIFVVQRHKATRLHYDFRLEANGVLKSWAVPKGPSMNPEDKRLAMMVEDHPYDYKDFAGEIPKGNYGAGIVEIWDNGTYSNLDEIQDKKEIETQILQGLEKGSVKFHLYGKKLKGEFALVKTNREDYQENAWLLIKHNDKYAIKGLYNSEDYTDGDSPINEYLEEKTKSTPQKSSSRTSTSQVTRITENKLPETGNNDLIKPMLAKEVPKPFDSPDWIFEIKWDGYRAIAEIDNGSVRLYSRNGVMFNKNYPLLIQALQKIKGNMVLDGEIVLTDEEGRPDFGRLQDYPNNTHYPLIFYVFDILYLNKKNICNKPLLERKKILTDNVKFNEYIKYTDHFSEEGVKFFDAIKKLDLEGIMAKKANSEYLPGKRTNNWLKIKQHSSREVYIAGFTAPTGERKHFGSLILAYKENAKIIYAGHVGTGFNDNLLKDVHKQVSPYIIKNSPFDIKIPTKTPITWVEPVIQCEVKFSEITKAGIMRHPVFVNIIATEKQIKKEPMQETITKKTSPKGKEKIYEIEGIEVKLSHPDKIYFPESKITKAMLADYYFSIAEYILPYLKNRPQSLKRNPNGIHEPAFYHKNAGEDAPQWVDTQKVFSESSNKEIDYILCNNKASLIYLINLGCIELNPWHSMVDNIENPDYLIIDLDPSNNNTFSQVIEAAQVIKTIIDRAKVECYCKTSGATGLHIYIPLGGKYSYDEAKDFAHIICMLANEQIPDFTTLERNLQKRGKDKIYLDYLQNRRGQTIASVYSVRPNAGAPVSFPLNWKEVKDGLNPLDFSINNVPQRLNKQGDIFAGTLGKGIDMHKCLKVLHSFPE